MKIEKINPSNASSASHIYALSWKEAYKGIVSQRYLDDLSLERWTSRLENSAFSGYLLSDHQEAIATSSVGKSREEAYSDWGEILSIYVLPKYYHQGYGKKLLQYVMNQLHQQGFNKLFLWVLEENKIARSFYEKNGFSFNGEHAIIEIDSLPVVEVRYVYIYNE